MSKQTNAYLFCILLKQQGPGFANVTRMQQLQAAQEQQQQQQQQFPGGSPQFPGGMYYEILCDNDAITAG